MFKDGLSRRGVLLAASTVAVEARAQAASGALTLMIIRHAEKPEEAWPGPGLTLEGGPNTKSLVVRGWQRSGAWATLFGFGLADYPSPRAIYAAAPNFSEGRERSARPYETVIPLAARLGLTVNTSFAVGEEAGLAAELLRQTGVVLVCWEHKMIGAAMLPGLVGRQSIPGLPAAWHGARYDLVLRLDRATPTSPWVFREMFPRLLAGDTDTPMT